MPGLTGVSGLSGLSALTGDYIDKVLSYDPIAYWPLYEASGTTAVCLVNSAQNGTYSNVTLANAIGPDNSNYAPWFSGGAGDVNILTAAFSAAFNNAEGTIMIWARVNNAAVWTDGVSRRALTIRTNGTNQVHITKNSANNQLNFQYVAGGNSEVWTPAFNSTDWHHTALTWSKSGDVARAFINGSQSGGDAVGLGNWAGALAVAHISSLAAGGNFYHGWLAHAVVFDSALTPAQILDLADI